MGCSFGCLLFIFLFFIFPIFFLNILFAVRSLFNYKLLSLYFHLEDYSKFFLSFVIYINDFKGFFFLVVEVGKKLLLKLRCFK